MWIAQQKWMVHIRLQTQSQLQTQMQTFSVNLNCALCWNKTSDWFEPETLRHTEKYHVRLQNIHAQNEVPTSDDVCMLQASGTSR